MPIKILMPALSPTMEEGNLAKWHKTEGEPVEAGDVLAEIETDKATMEVEAIDEGVLGRIVVPEGTEGVKVNAVIALLLEDGEDASALDSVDIGAPPPAAPEPAPAAAGGTAAAVAAAPSPAPSAPPPARAAAGPAAAQDQAVNGRIKASPLARRMARQAGLDLAALKGSGPHGRIVRRDIETALEGGPAAARPPTTPAAARPAPLPGAGGPAYEDVPHSGVRKVIATRLTEADREVPQFYLTVDCEVDRLLAARKEINDAADGAYKVSVNDMVIKAAALALRKVPGVNAQWTDSAMRMLNTVDISIAVAYEGGLITPIIFDADRKGIAQISEEMKALAARARDGKLMPEEYQGGSFSISNLGMFGVRQFTAIINPPQASILAVGAGEQRPVVRAGDITVATIMSCTLTCDHRVVDGALGAQFMQAFRTFIEAPATMLA